MKSIVKFLVVVTAMVSAAACSKPNDTVSDYLDVTANNIKGVWRMTSYDNGSQFAE